MSSPADPIHTEKSIEVIESPVPPQPLKRKSWKRLGAALAVAAISDVIAFAVVLLPPLQIAVDVVTAGILFLILGRRLALLPGLVAEAIPGMGLFPVWILVVISIIVYDDIKARKLTDTVRTVLKRTDV